jgi:hypothetical protein
MALPLQRSARFFNPTGADRCAAVRIEPAADREFHVIHVERGPTAAALKHQATLGPFTEDQVQAAFDAAGADLRNEGFLEAGVEALQRALEQQESVVRGRAAEKLGWRRSRDTVETLLALLPQASEELCPILDALGRIGDDRATPSVRAYATRKLLSRRRSAVEALRNLGDGPGLDEARQLALERLPQAVRDLVEQENTAGDQLATQVNLLDAQQLGLALDTLYELATPAAVGAVREVLGKTTFDREHLWRATKSIYKRALLRGDFATFGWLSHAIEARGRVSKGAVATVKSGLDGVSRKTRIFGKNTQDYMRRLAWRYLRNLALYRPEDYASAAAEAIIHYTPQEIANRTRATGFGGFYLLHRVLLGNSTRFDFAGREMRFRLKSAKLGKVSVYTHEEAHERLWEARPRAYLRVLTAAKLPECHEFALRRLMPKHHAVVRAADDAEIIALLDAPYEPTVQLGLAELERRFDPEHPDWGLLQRLLQDARPTPRELGQRWLKLTAPLWTRDPERVLFLLRLAHPSARGAVIELAKERLAADKGLRQVLAQMVRTALAAAEPAPGVHDALAQLAAEALAVELGALLGVAQLIGWITSGTPTVKVLAGRLLGVHPDAVRELGLERLTALAQHEVVAVREAAHALLRSAREQLQQDPSVLFVLVESEWDDTRTVAFDLLKAIPPEALGLDGLMGLLDSNRVDVQNAGAAIAQQHFGTFTPDKLVFRLVEHPHQNMRRFALDLVTKHLPAGTDPLVRLKEFCRTALFDLWPQRKVKSGVIDFLTQRGLEDAGQAQVVATILGDVVRVQGRADFEQALTALVRLKLAYPELETTVTLSAGGVV